MELWAILRQKLTALPKRRQLDRDLEDEMAFHLAMRQQKLRAEGMSEHEASAASRRAFGNASLLKEKTRELWMFRWLEDVAQDLRYATRSLRNAPVLATVVILSLALGIGANTAIFSLMNAVILRYLPVEKPQELVTVLRQAPGRSATNGFSNPLWEALRDQQDVFSGVFAVSPALQFDMAQGGVVRNVNGFFASGNFFNTLGVLPAAGRLLVSDDDKRGCSPVAVLGHQFWQSHFGGVESAIGGSIALNGMPFLIVGVSPARFHGVEVGKDFDVTLPLCASAMFDSRNIDSRTRWYLDIIGRAKAGVTHEQLNARLEILAPSVMRAAMPTEWDSDGRQRLLKTKLLAVPAATGTSDLRDTFGEPLKILMAFVGVVLLIACANIASLMLAKATTRRKEIAIRKAIGASQNRLVRQLLTETVLLSLLGAGLGVLFARWGSSILVSNLSTGRNSLFIDLSLEWRVLAFTAVLAMVVGILMGLLPALRATDIELMEAMKARTAAGGEHRSRFRAGKWIVAGQVALSLVLLIGGGLLLRTFVKLLTLDLGFDRSNVLVVVAKAPWFAEDTVKIQSQRRTATYAEIGRRLRAIPGVSSSALSYTTPIGDDNWYSDLHSELPDAPSGEAATVYFNFVSPGYFATLRIPLSAGRDFDERDTANASKTAIINETLARKFFPGVNALGRHFKWGTEPGQVEVVGIVKDSKYESVRQQAPATAFLPAAQVPARAFAEEFELRTSGPPSTLIPAVKLAVAEVNPQIPLEFHTLADQVNDNLVQERLLAKLSGFFGTLALLLAMIGLYGVLSYLVTQRQAEFGIRMALGAQPVSILRLVMGDVVVLLAGGLATGLAISLVTVKLLQKLLYGMESRDPITMVCAVCFLAAMALLAAYLPARRATRVDPMIALRYE